MPRKVRELIRLIEDDGWSQGDPVGISSSVQAPDEAWTRDDRRQAFDGCSGGDGAVHTEAGWLGRTVIMASYVVLIESGPTSVGASCPDLPGVIAVADTEPEVMQLMSEAIQLHIAGLREDGLPIPAPSIMAVEIQVGAA